MVNKVGGRFLRKANKKVTQRSDNSTTVTKAQTGLLSNKNIMQRGNGNKRIRLSVNRRTKIRVKKV